MELLPIEIVNEILLLADRPSLYHASQVCSQWQRLSLKQVKTIKNAHDLYKGCKRGDRLSIVKSKYNPNWAYYAFRGACRGGHKELVELMIAKGANDWDEGLYNACKAGHKELTELMIAKGANSCGCGKSIQQH